MFVVNLSVFVIVFLVLCTEFKGCSLLLTVYFIMSDRMLLDLEQFNFLLILDIYNIIKLALLHVLIIYV